MNDPKSIKWIIADQFGVSVELVKEDSKLDDFSGDSLDQVEIIMAIEDEYDIEFSDSALENVETVAQLREAMLKACED